MNSKIIIGIPLSIIAITMVYNYNDSPPVAFDNILGYYDVVGGPYEGCISLEQPGAGIKVTANFNDETPKNTLKGQVDGSIFNFEYTLSDHSGTASLAVEKPILNGTWTGTDGNGDEENGTWVFTKRDQACR